MQGGAPTWPWPPGCGITPVLPVVRSLLAGGAARVLVFYGNSSTARAMCLEELLALKDRHLGALSLHFLMSREPQEVELYNGRLDEARVRALRRDPVRAPGGHRSTSSVAPGT